MISKLKTSLRRAGTPGNIYIYMYVCVCVCVFEMFFLKHNVFPLKDEFISHQSMREMKRSGLALLEIGRCDMKWLKYIDMN